MARDDHRMAASNRRRVAQAGAFTQAAYLYWCRAFPQALGELQMWHARAERIPDAALRDAALGALENKQCDLEGAIGFAAMLASRVNLSSAVRAITSFQLAFDYLDCVVELPNPDPVTNSQSLHEALYVALSAGAAHPDYYQHQSSQDDACYLRLLVDTCRDALQRLPSCDAVRAPASHALKRVVTYQSLSHGDHHGSYEPFLLWAESQTPPDTEMYWWEAGAATGSQLSVLALIAAAGDPCTGPEDAYAIEQAYYPWVGALSTLLDSVVDREHDRVGDQPSLLDHYRSPNHVAERLRLMATEAMAAVQLLADGDKHRMLLAAMGAFFHIRPESAQADASIATKAAMGALGSWAIPAQLMLKARKWLCER
jgi:tetraprenyl-beta-curcumene synthase